MKMMIIVNYYNGTSETINAEDILIDDDSCDIGTETPVIRPEEPDRPVVGFGINTKEIKKLEITF